MLSHFENIAAARERAWATKRDYAYIAGKKIAPATRQLSL